MKKYKIDPAKNLYEVVVPVCDDPNNDGLFDDCPVCQQLRQDLQHNKRPKGIVIQWEEDEAS